MQIKGANVSGQCEHCPQKPAVATLATTLD